MDEARDKVRINFWLGKKLYETMESIAVDQGRSLSDLIRESIRDYVSKHVEEKDGKSNG